MIPHPPKMVLPVAVLTTLLALPASGAAQATATFESGGDDAQAVRDVVATFHDALATGDAEGALALLADDATVLEGGNLETRDEYAEHHLPADMAFAQAVPRERGEVDVTVEGRVAWATSTSTVEGSYRGREIASRTAELMVLRQEAGSWRIVAIHWSSRSLRRG